jgi:hypothetical protein
MEKDTWCYYSDLPSPSAYSDVTDYDGMGNFNRMPKIKKKTFLLKKLLLRIFKKKSKV